MRGNNSKYGKNSWKVGIMNFVLTLIVVIVIGGIAVAAFFFIRPRYEAYKEAKAVEEQEEQKRLAKEADEAKAASEAEEKRIAEEKAKKEAEEKSITPTPMPTNTQVPDSSDGYIIADSNSRYLTEADVKEMSIQQVNYAKNEIYARRGRKFLSNELMSYFSSKSWYNGTIEPDAFNSSMFNQYELANVEFLAKIEKSMNPNGYQLDK